MEKNDHIAAIAVMNMRFVFFFFFQVLVHRPLSQWCSNLTFIIFIF